MTTTLPWLLPAAVSPESIEQTRAYISETCLPDYDPPTVFADSLPHTAVYVRDIDLGAAANNQKLYRLSDGTQVIISTATIWGYLSKRPHTTTMAFRYAEVTNGREAIAFPPLSDQDDLAVNVTHEQVLAALGYTLVDDMPEGLVERLIETVSDEVLARRRPLWCGFGGWSPEAA